MGIHWSYMLLLNPPVPCVLDLHIYTCIYASFPETTQSFEQQFVVVTCHKLWFVYGHCVTLNKAHAECTSLLVASSLTPVDIDSS